MIQPSPRRLAPRPSKSSPEPRLESIVVVYQQGRDSDVQGTGTGFIVSPEGLIATNWHVINDRRQIEVELHDGTKYPVVEVHASDRRLDLALIRIAPEAPLTALKLGDSDSSSKVNQSSH